jgi:predicted flap endonuclease-1-like 5' DNA nuclease
MELIREYWWVLPVALAIALILFFLLRPRQRVTLTDSAPVRPHMAASTPAEGRGLVGEAAAAASDVTGEILGAPVHSKLDNVAADGDDLTRLKGVGPRLAEALAAQGFVRFEQIAGLNPNEVERLDTQLGAFRGRITRDRIVEQAAYLARGDVDGFEQKFGKL